MINELWSGGPKFNNADGVFRLCTDSVLLAYFAGLTRIKCRRAVDLGCGSGVIGLLLAWNNAGVCVDGIEIDARAAELADDNAKLCGLSGRFSVICADLRRHRELLCAGAYDMCVSNPPYYARGSGKSAERDGLLRARGEETCTLSDVCTAAGYFTRWGGSFSLVHKPERLAETFYALRDSGFEPKRMRFVQHKPGTSPSLALIEARRGGKPSLVVDPPLILTGDDGGDSYEVRQIYHRGDV